MRLNVSSIQHFSTGDGDGIRTTVFLKGCNLHCPWCHNPETVPKEPTVLRYPTGEVVNGTWTDIDDVVREVVEDIDFYENGGGVTVSGGEPLLQSEGVSELICKLKGYNIPAIIDTAGCVPYSAFEELRGKVHTYFFDLKAADENGYNTVGGNFNLVRDNLKRLLEDGNSVRVRIPLIPGFNDYSQYSERMCDVLKGVGATNVDLLPFHRLGSGKYEALGIPYAYSETKPMTIEHAKKVAEIYSKYFNVRIEK